MTTLLGKLRQRYELTLEEVAKKTGLSIGTIQNYERYGGNQGSARYWDKFAAFYKVPSWQLRGQEPPTLYEGLSEDEIIAKALEIMNKRRQKAVW
jgi:transcriptional regulator with XRE-family HTH domain